MASEGRCWTPQKFRSPECLQRWAGGRGRSYPQETSLGQAHVPGTGIWMRHFPPWLLRPDTPLPLGMFQQLLTCPAGSGWAQGGGPVSACGWGPGPPTCVGHPRPTVGVTGVQACGCPRSDLQVHASLQHRGRRSRRLFTSRLRPPRPSWEPLEGGHLLALGLYFPVREMGSQLSSSPGCHRASAVP